MSLHPARQELTTYRNYVSGCTRCKGRDGCNVFNTPRFGLGKRATRESNRPPLMLLGQNPPVDNERCLHGAFMLPYSGPEWDKKKGAHEDLVTVLVQRLGFDPTTIWSSQAIKCPTPNNDAPSMAVLRNCQTILGTEIRDVHPRVILGFGRITEMAVDMAFGYYYGTDWTQLPVEPIGLSPEANIRIHDNMVFAPHPSMVGRFIDRESWMSGIEMAVALASGRERPLTRFELGYIKDHGTAGVEYIHEPSLNRWRK